ncbi:MAG: HdeD family acid-resistance protein [Pseudonocardia sp.]
MGSVVLGLLTVLYGLLVMSLRPAALATIAVLAGVALIAGGIVQLTLAEGVDRRWRWLAYVAGLVSMAAGIAAFAWPGLTLLVLAVLVAWSFVVNGVLRIAGSITGRDRDLWWLGLLAGAVELLLGLWAIGAPGREVLLLVNLVGIYLVIVGVDAMATALAGRSGHQDPV